MLRRFRPLDPDVNRHGGQGAFLPTGHHGKLKQCDSIGIILLMIVTVEGQGYDVVALTEQTEIGEKFGFMPKEIVPIAPVSWKIIPLGIEGVRPISTPLR